MNAWMHLRGPMIVGVMAAVSIVIGAHIVLRQSKDTKESSALTRVFSFGTGAFFTAVCLDFLPDAWSGEGDSTPLWLFIGALILWAATNASDSLFNREQSRPDVASESAVAHISSGSGENLSDPLSTAILRFTPVSAVILTAALSFHTFLEGAAVALAFQHLNWTTFGFSLAMILHKLPEGVLWGLALAAVFPQDRAKIRRVLLIPAVCTLVGVFLGIMLADQASSQVTHIATGLVAGAMFYIAFAELLPALRDHSHPRLARSWFVIGLVVMFLLSRLSSVFGG